MSIRHGVLIGLLLTGVSHSVQAESPFPPEAVSGSLVIVGGGKLPDAVRDEFFKLAGDKDKARIVVIPTANADADDPKKAEAFLKQWKISPRSVSRYSTRGIECRPTIRRLPNC